MLSLYRIIKGSKRKFYRIIKGNMRYIFLNFHIAHRKSNVKKILPNLAIVEKKVRIAERSKSPLKMIVQLLLTRK